MVRFEIALPKCGIIPQLEGWLPANTIPGAIIGPDHLSLDLPFTRFSRFAPHPITVFDIVNRLQGGANRRSEILNKKVVLTSHSGFRRHLSKLISIAAILILAVTVWMATGVAHADGGPKDPFIGASPSIDSPELEATNQILGDWGVAEQRGAATYTYRFDVPSGRNGMEPNLLLRYSSQSPIRGGLAVGWTLDDLPTISVDKSRGVENKIYYKATLGAVSGRLIEVPDKSVYGGATFRAEFDQTFARFERVALGSNTSEFQINGGWLALTTDGVRHYFQESVSSSDFQTRWRLTKQVDPYGNTIHFEWDRVAAPLNAGYVEFVIKSISYTSNEAARLEPHAMVEFNYAPIEFCGDSNVSHRRGNCGLGSRIRKSLQRRS